MTENAELLINGSQGIYIPEIFADIINWDLVQDIEEMYKPLSALLNGPEDPIYWDQWQYLLDCCVINHPSGKTYVLYQDSDLWLVPSNEIDQIPEM